MSNGINDRQNSERVIHKLRAQGYLYSLSERFEWTTFIVSVAIVIMFSFMRIIWQHNDVLTYIATFYGVAATISVLILSVRQSSMKEKAAKIQQEIDIEIFQLSWDDYICGKNPQAEDIAKYCNKNKGSDKYRNWYKGILDEMPLNEGRILGMAQNITFDFSVRSKFIHCLYVTWAILAIAIIVVSVSFNIRMLSFFSFIVVPLMPIIVWSLKVIQSNKSDIAKLREMKIIFNCLCKKLKVSGTVEEAEIQSLQNCIYLYRKSAYKIPDFFFRLHHQVIETEYDYVIQEKILQDEVRL